MPSVSLYLDYGGDFQMSPTGGLKLAVDTQSEATSTIQRIQRLLFTNPSITNQGNIIARGDCLFYPEYGAGVPALVDANVTNAQISALKATIFDQLSLDPGISRVPAPIVTTSFDSSQALTISVQVTTNSGQVVTTPAYPISGVSG